MTYIVSGGALNSAHSLTGSQKLKTGGTRRKAVKHRTSGASHYKAKQRVSGHIQV